MLSVNLSASSSTGFQATTPQTRAVAAAASTDEEGTGKAPVSVKVELSTAAIEKAKAAASDSADSTDPIKMLQKRIKELQKQIAEAQARLQAVMSNKSLSPELKQTQASSIQSELAQLTAALFTASASLIKLIEKNAKTAAK
ncbi:DUF1931 family protein [Pseudomonas sp. GG8]